MASQRNRNPDAFGEITLSVLDEGRFAELRALYAVTWRATYEARLGAETVSGMVARLSEPSVGGMVPAQGQVFGASQNGSLVGAVAVREAGGVAYVWGLTVLPRHQRSGVGRRLMEAAIGRLRTARAVEVRVLKASPGALAFYEALGFRVIREEEAEMFEGVSKRLLVMEWVRGV